MRNKIYKIASLYNFFLFEDDLIVEFKDRLLSIEKKNELSGLLIIAKEGLNGTICGEEIVVDTVINFCLLYTSPSPRDS